jgi:glycolate oxidase FAD binding subunit
MATADSGPLRHRYGGVRDLVLGTTVVLSDGTVARSGGRVIKNVAGYDLAKLFAGSFGTLGLIATVSVRLHPLAANNATARGRSADPERLQAAAIALAKLPLEANCLDVCWEGGAGSVLVRHSGATAVEQARATAGRMEGLEQVETIEDDAAIWERQRALQRSPGAVVKVSGRATDLANVLRAAGDATVVSRAALGLSWIALPAGDDLAERVAAIRAALAPRACTVLDGADKLADPWPDPGPGVVVMERLKARFDPARIFRPGTFVGGI